mgnify:CR=1 FL=1|tara:strand:+ start:218 stop:466 length:249 start_codon:yes stop_codon:yes gene_type:complete
MRVGDVKKYLPKDDDEQIVIAWWEYGDGESWPEWLTKKMWDYYVDRIDSKHDWSYEHEAIWEHFEYLRKEYPIPSRWLEEEE